MIDITQVFDGTPPTTGVALTVTRPSTNVLDMLVSRDIGNGNAVYCNVLFPVALATGTSLQIAYQTSNTEGSGYVDLILSPVILTANLKAGTRYGFVVPRNQFNNATAGVNLAPGRYHRLNYTIAGTFDAGTVMAWLSATPDSNCFYIYPKNYVAYVDPDQIAV